MLPWFIDTMARRLAWLEDIILYTNVHLLLSCARVKEKYLSCQGEAQHANKEQKALLQSFDR